jgi:hypothetical protein
MGVAMPRPKVWRRNPKASPCNSNRSRSCIDSPASWVVMLALPGTEVPKNPLPKLWAPPSPPKWLRGSHPTRFHPTEAELVRVWPPSLPVPESPGC